MSSAFFCRVRTETLPTLFVKEEFIGQRTEVKTERTEEEQKIHTNMLTYSLLYLNHYTHMIHDPQSNIVRLDRTLNIQP